MTYQYKIHQYKTQRFRRQLCDFLHVKQPPEWSVKVSPQSVYTDVFSPSLPTPAQGVASRSTLFCQPWEQSGWPYGGRATSRQPQSTAGSKSAPGPETTETRMSLCATDCVKGAGLKVPCAVQLPCMTRPVIIRSGYAGA